MKYLLRDILLRGRALLLLLDGFGHFALLSEHVESIKRTINRA